MKRKKLQTEIRQGLIESRLSERKLDKHIKRIQRQERQVLLEVRSLLDQKRYKEARILAMPILDSRKIVKKLTRMKFVMRRMQFLFEEAKSGMIAEDTILTMVQAMNNANRLLSADQIDRTLVALEYETTELELKTEMATESFETFEDPLLDEEKYIDDIVVEVGKVSQNKVNKTIDNLLDAKRLLPSVPLEELADSDLLDEEEDEITS